MSVKTKEQLKQDFSDNQTATGAKFADLIDSLKAVQSAVSDPAASGMSITFIATISQDTNGVITVTKKTVNFQGYQPVARMARYQELDVQTRGSVVITGDGSDVTTVVAHNKNHYPTVRLIDDNGTELRPTGELIEPYVVTHADLNNLEIILVGALNTPNAKYIYILD